MQKKGLITLMRDEGDRRRQTISISKAGQKIIDDKIDQAVQIVNEFKKKLGVENYELLLDLLAKLDPHSHD
jgi:DNA-binding MarR family transcriptional regulator